MSPPWQVRYGTSAAAAVLAGGDELPHARPLVAMRPVAAGEELTTDYALVDDHAGQMDRSCGAGNCWGSVDGHDRQRPELQRRYRGYFSWFVQRKIDATDRQGQGDPR